MNLYGMKIIESPLIQPTAKVSLSADCPCSESVRNDFNSWLLEMFGAEMRIYIIGGHTALVHPKHMAMLRIATSTPEFRGATRLYRGASLAMTG